MKAIMTLHNWASEIVTSWWTPAFVLIFLAVLTYALWPTNRSPALSRPARSSGPL